MGLHVVLAMVSAAWSLAPLYTFVNGIGLIGYLGLACLACLACLAVALVAILLSNSRATLLACLLAWALVVLRERGALQVMAVPVAAAAALGLLAVSLGGGAGLDEVFGGLARSGSASELTTLTGRTEIWAVAADLIAQRPLLGWGYNDTEQLVADSVPTTFYGSHVNTHNMSVQLVLGLGFVAGLLWRLLRSPDPTRDQVILLMVVSGLSEAPIFILPAVQNLVVFAVLARDAAWRVRPPEADRARGRRGPVSAPRRHWAAGPLALIVLLAGGPRRVRRRLAFEEGFDTSTDR